MFLNEKSKLEIFIIVYLKPIFRTLPSKRITRVELAGKIGEQYDRIFASSLSNVTGYSKKGKAFFNFETNMTEPIKSIGVLGDYMGISGSYVYNLYKQTQEIGYYVCPDKINDLLILSSDSSKITSVLACNDRVLRVLEVIHLSISLYC